MDSQCEGLTFVASVQEHDLVPSDPFFAAAIVQEWSDPMAPAKEEYPIAANALEEKFASAGFDFARGTCASAVKEYEPATKGPLALEPSEEVMAACRDFAQVNPWGECKIYVGGNVDARY